MRLYKGLPAVRSWRSQEPRVPTLFRLLIVIAVVAAVVYGAMVAMVSYLQPQPHAISQTVTLPARPK